MLRTVLRSVLRASSSRGGGGQGSGRQRVRVSFDGHVAGYVVVAVLGACAGYGIARQEHLRERGSGKQRKQHAAVKQPQTEDSNAPMNVNATPATASPFSSTAIQPYSAPLPSSSTAAPSLPLLTSLTPAQVAAHPLLSAIGPFGLPQLPFQPGGGGSETVDGFHMTPPLFLRQAYIAAYNTKLHTPDWCLEMLTREGSALGNSDAFLEHDSSSSSSSAAVSRDHSSFKSDPFIASSFQASPSLFRYSGWDRGHLVPAADVSSSATSSSPSAHTQKALDETFVMTNIAAQDPNLNRGYWLQLEHHLRKLARQHERVFVVTGPLFIPETIHNDTAATKIPSSKNNQESSSGDELAPAVAADSKAASNNGSRQLRLEVLGSGPSSFVAVPTHFFKVVLVAPPAASSSSFFPSTPPLQLAAFIVPNAPVPLSTPLSSFQVPLEQVEHYCGWQMFGRVPRSGNSASAKGSKSTALAPRSLVVRDLCANGGCELKIKDFQFNNKS